MIAATAEGVVIEVLAKARGVPKRAVTIVAGGRSRAKRVAVAGMTKAAAEARTTI
ncbi:MAG: DUF167 domain-containing protein [Acidimicrobiia bacterium]|nr:DUF167 domain-containing protein [Acidimicrobiia bacterium]